MARSYIMALHAQVFISCGQREELGEVEVAQKLAAGLAEAGFEPYLATKQQTLRGLKENIFERLAQSEYFLFVDFKRELIAGTEPALYRGSVFSQQELAVAAHLDIEVIAFQEEGVKPFEGILGFMQANCVRFRDRASLPTLVMGAVRERGWSANWKNALSIEGNVDIHRNVVRLPEGSPADFYHLIIRNNHHYRTARNVYGYLERVADLTTGGQVDFEAAEFKWAGYTLPNATIPAQSTRKLDALWIPHSDPLAPRFNAFTDSTHFIPRLRGPGEWRLVYSAISDTVPGASREFRLYLDGSVGGVRLDSV
jgi:hypothetical protein